MVDTPDIAAIGRLIGDRARATILMALMAGRALTATELARAAAVTKQTASSHLSKLVEARLVAVENVGRHRYFRLANHDVGAVIENLVGLAHRLGAVQVTSGPADPAMRRARVCYDHLAGELGVLVFDSLRQQHLIHADERRSRSRERARVRRDSRRRHRGHRAPATANVSLVSRLERAPSSISPAPSVPRCWIASSRSAGPRK